MTDSEHPININTLHNVHGVEEVIQLTIESDAEIIANSHWTADLFSRTLSRLLHRC